MSNARAPVFYGRDGEDPKEYLEDVEDFALSALNDDDKHPRYDRKLRSTFRFGLQGDAKTWYDQTRSDKRENWIEISELFKRRFKLRLGRKNPELLTVVEYFERRQDEKLSYYLARADDLSYKVSDRQLEKLRDRLYRNMCNNGNDADRHIQARVCNRLIFGRLLDDEGDFADRCTYDDVSDQISSCAVVPGQESRFFEEIEQKARPGPDSLSMERIVKEFGRQLLALSGDKRISRGDSTITTPGRFAGQTYYPPQHEYQVA